MYLLHLTTMLNVTTKFHNDHSNISMNDVSRSLSLSDKFNTSKKYKNKSTTSVNSTAYKYSLSNHQSMKSKQVTSTETGNKDLNKSSSNSPNNNDFNKYSYKNYGSIKSKTGSVRTEISNFEKYRSKKETSLARTPKTACSITSHKTNTNDLSYFKLCSFE